MDHYCVKVGAMLIHWGKKEKDRFERKISEVIVTNNVLAKDLLEQETN